MILGHTFGHLRKRSGPVLNRRQPIVGDYTMAAKYRHDDELREAPLLRLRDEDDSELVRCSYVIGVDLGAMVDPAAMAVVRTRIYDERFMGPRWPYTEVIWLQRWPTGDPGFYPRIKREVIDLAMQLPGAVTIVPDHGGVGVAWTAELREYAQQVGFTGRVVPVASTGNNSNALTHTDRNGKLRMTVPKIELVSALNLAQQARIVNPCPVCQQTMNAAWRVKDLAKVVSMEPERLRNGDTGMVVYVDGGNVGIAFPDGEEYEYDAAELVKASGAPETDGCQRCAKLRFTKTVDREEYRHLMAELKSFEFVQRAATGQNRIEQGTRTGVKHHGDAAMALALALWFTGRGNRQLVMHVGGK